MTRLAQLAIASLLLLMCAGDAQREARRQELKREEAAIKATVTDMVERTNAVNDWEEKLLQGEKGRFTPILTVELVKAWLTERPILFVGTIRDVATLKEHSYIVTIERDIFHTMGALFLTDLELSLRSSKERIDAFLNQHPPGPLAGVAVVASIEGIESEYAVSADDSRERVRVGVGELIDIAHIGSVVF